MWKQRFDIVLPTYLPNVWKVEKGGKHGVFDDGQNALIVPVEFSVVLFTHFNNIWRIKDGGMEGIYNSDKAAFIVPLAYDWVYETNLPHIWIVEKHGKKGIYNSDVSIFPVPLKYDFISGDLTHNNIWRIRKGGGYGIYDSETMNELLCPVFYNVLCGDDDIFLVVVGPYKELKFDSKKHLWVDSQAVISFCEDNMKDMLKWVYLYSPTPEKMLEVLFNT